MLNSDQRMDYIIRYISAYENKIKLANKQGLFDAAKKFELFAANVCALWFDRPFENLNSEVSNYPYVDLISKDQKLLVQVSTAQNVSRKIKRTLEKIRDSKDSRVSYVETIIFFLLHNQDIDHVPDFAGDTQIGSISFTRADNLISTQDILKKAQYDLEFQTRLYDLLKADELDSEEDAFRSALDFSKNVGLKNIDYYINGEYQIDRSVLLDAVRKDNYRFISVQGSAGSGKSAFCRMLVENEEMVLYARAERFAEETNLNRIWDINVEKVLTYINGKKLTFFIDALEFIADSPQTKFELLQQLYIIAGKFENVYIITSCRSSEKSAFMKLEANLNIHSYTIEDLSEKELHDIAENFAVIKEMCGIKAYNSLLHTPFYINLILHKKINPSDIHDETALREYIWNNVICLKDRASKYGLKYNEIVNTINKIVFLRAKKTLLGVSLYQIDSNISKALLSEGILIEQKGYLRLKYDIFEDICFEQHFDIQFQDCKGAYQQFFESIETLGRCVYRRYQIWVSNKLFGLDNRIKFLHELIFTDTIPSNWKRQTEIGIVKSRHCASFFEEQAANLQENNILDEFTTVTNLFAFKGRIDFSSSDDPMLRLFPIGEGRASLIKLINNNRLYSSEKEGQVVKLCNDYARQQNSKSDIALQACNICSHYADIILGDIQNKDYYSISERIRPSINVLYQLPKQSSYWLSKFFELITDFYKSDERNKVRVAEDIIKWTMKNTYPQLVKEFSKELCELFCVFWTYKINNLSDQFDVELEQLYGLNENAHFYASDHRTVVSNTFFNQFFFLKLFDAVDWVISFVNNSISSFAKSRPAEVEEVQIIFSGRKQANRYWGNAKMWLSSIEENKLPTLISDMIFLLKEIIIYHIEAYMVEDDKLGEKLAYCIKERLYEKANNVALLTIIECIGLHFAHKLSGYALELASNELLVSWDNQRIGILCKNPTQILLEKQILQIVGLPNINPRYCVDSAYNIDLSSYANLSSKSIVSRGGKNSKHIAANETRRTSDQSKITVEIKMRSDSSVKEIKEENVDSIKVDETKENYTLPEILSFIDCLANEVNRSVIGFQYENTLITYIAFAMQQPGLSENKRTEFCRYWINCIRRLLSKGSFVAETKLCVFLFQQVHNDISIDMKNEIKLLLLDLILYHGDNGLISKYADFAKIFIAKEENISHAMLNTIIKLAEDEMNHQTYNAEYLSEFCGKDRKEFIPNMTPRPRGVDNLIQREGIKPVYKSLRDTIVRKYLYDESDFNIENFKIEHFDLPTLLCGFGCGAKISDPFFAYLAGKIIACMIDLWYFHRLDQSSHDVLDVFYTQEAITFFWKHIIETSADYECAIDLLFTNVDFSKFTEETIEFYQNIFGHFLPEFLDGWSDLKRRQVCIKKIRYLEKKVNNINDEYVKIQLYKSLFFSVPKYCAVSFTQCPTKYSYEDICFLNDQFSKYGKYHFDEMLLTIYQLHIDELLPYILISVNNCISEAMPNKKQLSATIEKNYVIIQKIIYKAFIKWSEKIKSDGQLIFSYKNILQALVELNHEDAAVILDEFRLH